MYEYLLYTIISYTYVFLIDNVSIFGFDIDFFMKLLQWILIKCNLLEIEFSDIRYNFNVSNDIIHIYQ